MTCVGQLHLLSCSKRVTAAEDRASRPLNPLTLHVLHGCCSHCRALSLGVVSKRRIYAEAAAALQQQPEQARPAGLNPLAHLAWLLTSSGGAAAAQRRQRKASAAAAAAEARDFHEQMAVAREGR